MPMMLVDLEKKLLLPVTVAGDGGGDVLVAANKKKMGKDHQIHMCINYISAIIKFINVGKNFAYYFLPSKGSF